MKEHWIDQLRRLRRDKVAMLGAVFLLVFMLSALFAPYLAPKDPNLINTAQRLLPPGGGHLLGTDEMGRDILSRLLYGARVSLTVGLVATSIGLGGGTVLGLLAGYYRRLDNLIMRLMDVMLAIPSILAAVAIVAALGTGLHNVMVAVGVSAIPGFARLTRSATLSVREQDFVQAARAAGARDTRIIFVHIMRNIIPTIIVFGSQQLASAILAASVLSFLGLGVQPPTAEWGAMVSTGKAYLRQAPYLSFIPSMAIFLVVMSFNLLGDALRDVLDPKMRGSL